jgi:hypothetical protein
MGYNHTYTVDKDENFDFKKLQQIFFDETDIKITVTGNDGQTGTFKLVIDYSTCLMTYDELDWFRKIIRRLQRSRLHRHRRISHNRLGS